MTSNAIGIYDSSILKQTGDVIRDSLSRPYWMRANTPTQLACNAINDMLQRHWDAARPQRSG